MNVNNQFIDEFDTLLLSAVNSGNVHSLAAYLLSTSDPHLYINRVYQETDEQKCTLLMRACLSGHRNVVSMLLKSFQPDLEVLNNIRISVKDQNQKIYEDVTVLWVVAALNNFDLVQLFVEHGARVNHTTKTNSTSLRCACFHGNLMMTRYLIEKGADVRIAKEHNDTNLILCVFRQHTELVTYLVDELGCDTNECDNEGRSSLYLAVERGSLELVRFLLHRGARNFPAAYDQLSPVMLAAEKRRTDLVDLLLPHCSFQEQIEGEELLGSAYACMEHGTCDLEKLSHCLTRTIELRAIHQIPKNLKESTHEVFNHRQECQTIDQIKKLRSNDDNMYIEALLIRERLLGISSLKYRNSLLYRGATLVNTSKYLQGFALWIYELDLHRQCSIPVSSKQLRYFVKTLAILKNKQLTIPIQLLCKLIEVIISTLQNSTKEFDHNLCTLLFSITITSQVLLDAAISDTDRRVFYQLICSINRYRYVTRENSSSLLHLSLNDRTTSSSTSIDRICKYPCLDTVRILLQCGADANATDILQNTPAHIFISNSSDCNEAILQLLSDAKAHLDYASASGYTPFDMASNLNNRQLLQGRMKPCLKCLCARVIQKNTISFRGKLAQSLITFVERH